MTAGELTLASIMAFLASIAIGYPLNQRYRNRNQIDGWVLFGIAAVSYLLTVSMFCHEAGKSVQHGAISALQSTNAFTYLGYRSLPVLALLALAPRISSGQKLFVSSIAIGLVSAAIFDIYYVGTIFQRFPGFAP